MPCRRGPLVAGAMRAPRLPDAAGAAADATSSARSLAAAGSAEVALPGAASAGAGGAPDELRGPGRSLLGYKYCWEPCECGGQQASAWHISQMLHNLHAWVAAGAL